jgi:hypothetical protein
MEKIDKEDVVFWIIIAGLLLTALGAIPGTDPVPVVQDGPQCFMADPVYTATVDPSIPLPPPPPPLPTLWDKGTEAETAAVNDFLWNEAEYPRLVEAVIHVESRGRIRAVSSAGALGLMQIMPRTAEYMAGLLDIHYEPGIEYVPQWNVRVGTAYLEYLVGRYHGNFDHALTAYHRGPSNTDYILRTYGALPPHVKAAYSDLVLKHMIGGK